MFVPNGELPNIKGLIVAGSAELKTNLTTSSLLDPRLRAILIRPLLVVACGGENGFNQAIKMASNSLKNVKFIQEQKLITNFMGEIARDSGKYCFGIKDTIQGLKMGAVESLICWENLDILRLQIQNPHTDVEQTLYLTPEEANNPKFYRDTDTNAELKVVKSEPFVEWIVVNYKRFGTKLDIITANSQEGNQFVKGFGGIGGHLRWVVQFEQFDEPEADSDDDFA